jgi:dTDP-glucose 4,6-dehydratase
MTRVLLTGGGGFVGHHTLEHILATTDWQVVTTDSFRHKGKTDRLVQVMDGHPQWRERVSVLTHDLAVPFSDQVVATLGGKIDYVIAMASMSHVDTSIANPVPFIRNNVDVILNTLELCREIGPRHVIVVSTDEVYGPEHDGKAHPEWDTILPSNPYSASKAAQEAIAISYWRSYGVPLQIVNCMNLIGERQDPEKFLPMLISKISAGEKVPIHGRPGDIGTRHYLHARNLADGMLWLFRKAGVARFPAHALPGELVAERPDRWNIVGPDRLSNLELARLVADAMGRKLSYELVDFHTARPGHDPHYGLDSAKLTKAGWTPPVPFRESLARTVQWSLLHPAWLL